MKAAENLALHAVKIALAVAPQPGRIALAALNVVINAHAAIFVPPAEKWSPDGYRPWLAVQSLCLTYSAQGRVSSNAMQPSSGAKDSRRSRVHKLLVPMTSDDHTNADAATSGPSWWLA
jgi:hypothetical protein